MADNNVPYEYEPFEEEALPEDVSELREVIEYLEETVLPRIRGSSSVETNALWMWKFPRGSRQYFWCILYLHKPHCTLYDGPQPMIENPHQ